MPGDASAPVWLSPLWLFQPPELITASSQKGSSSYPTPCTVAQGGNLITCLNKSQFKPPRGLAFCFDKPPERASLLQGCSWQFNTREWLIKEALGRIALLVGTARQNNKVCSFILLWQQMSGKSLKLSWVGTKQRCANCSPAMQAEIKRPDTPLPNNLRTTGFRIHGFIEQVFILFLDSMRHGGRIGRWQGTWTYILVCKDSLSSGSLQRSENPAEWNSHCPSPRHSFIKTIL